MFFTVLHSTLSTVKDQDTQLMHKLLTDIDTLTEKHRWLIEFFPFKFVEQSAPNKIPFTRFSNTVSFPNVVFIQHFWRIVVWEIRDLLNYWYFGRKPWIRILQYIPALSTLVGVLLILSNFIFTIHGRSENETKYLYFLQCARRMFRCNVSGFNGCAILCFGRTFSATTFRMWNVLNKLIPRDFKHILLGLWLGYRTWNLF